MLQDGQTVCTRTHAAYLRGPQVARLCAARQWSTPDPERVACDAEPVMARVNHGRWIVDCPCGGAELVWLDAPALWCSSCGNAALDGALRPVIVPSARHQERIAVALSVRPDETTRNWEWREWIGKLRNENRAHGLPLSQDEAVMR